MLTKQDHSFSEVISSWFCLKKGETTINASLDKPYFMENEELYEVTDILKVDLKFFNSFILQQIKSN